MRKAFLLALCIMLIASVSYAAFSSTQTETTVFGNKRIVIGTYTSADGAGTEGGDIETGLAQVDGLFLMPNDTAVETNASVVNETFPLQDGDVTIVTDASQSGYYMAIGT